jgi:hypothetical protein
VSTGAGNDTIDVTGVTGTGNFVVNAGDGNDTIVVSQIQLVAGNTIDGGAGTDTIKLGNGTAALAAGDYAVINSLVSNVEGIEFVNTIGGVNASKLAFTSLTFDQGGTVTGVSTQTLSTAGNLVATASGDAASTFDATTGMSNGDGTYAGNLNVTVTKGATLTLNADTATVNVKASTSAGTAAVINGDLQTSLTVNLTNSANNSTASKATADNLASATIHVDGVNNVALKSVVLTGNGTVTIDASASGALSNVDASQLGGTLGFGANKGNITNGLIFTGNSAIAETITLGSGHDVINVASSYGKMDTIVGFDAAKEGSTLASTSDVLTISAAQTGGTALTLDGLTALATGVTHEAGISVLALNASDSTLDLAFVHAAKAATTGNVVEFQFGGNTYLFADTNHNGVLDNSDFALKLVGTIDVTGAFGIPAATA